MRARKTLPMTRTTISFTPSIFQALKVRAAELNETVSELVERAVVTQFLEDAEDLQDAIARQNEPTHPFDDLVAELKKEGRLG